MMASEGEEKGPYQLDSATGGEKENPLLQSVGNKEQNNVGIPTCLWGKETAAGYCG